MEYKDIVSEIVLLINSGDSSLLNRPLEEDYLLDITYSAENYIHLINQRRKNNYGHSTKQN